MNNVEPDYPPEEAQQRFERHWAALDTKPPMQIRRREGQKPIAPQSAPPEEAMAVSGN